MFTRKSAPPAPAGDTKVEDNSRATTGQSSGENSAANSQPPSLPKMPSISQPGVQANTSAGSHPNTGTRIPQKPVAPHIPGAMPPQASAPSAGTAPRPPEPPRTSSGTVNAASSSVARPAPTQIDDDANNPSLRRMPEPAPMPSSDLYSPHQSAASAYRAPSPSNLSPADRGSDSGRLIVGKDIELKGEVKNCDLLVVEGTVEAVLVNTRSLEVTADGIFRGTAPVATAEISGLVEGDLLVEGHVFVRSTGIVNGNIEFGELEIERGGRVRGSMTQFGETTAQKKPASSRATKAK